MIMDGVVAVLLLITILYSWRLNKRISSLKSTKDDLSQLMKGFDDAIMRAEISIKELKHLTTQKSNEIQQKIDKAEYLHNDLVIMIEKSSDILHKIEKNIPLYRNSTKSISRYNRKVSSPISSLTEERAEKKELENEAINLDYNSSGKEEKKKTIESILNNISNLKNDMSLTPKEEVKSNYNPSIKRQDEFFNSLKRISSK